MLKTISIIFILYYIIIIVLTYYYNLLSTKNEYSKDDIGNLIPKLIGIWKTLIYKYDTAGFILITLISGFIGSIIPLILDNTVFNSSIIPLLLFFLIPKLGLFFEETRVTSSENFSDKLESYFVKYYIPGNSGFITGYASAVIFNLILAFFIFS